MRHPPSPPPNDQLSSTGRISDLSYPRNLPKHKIICTGDACNKGAFNFMGHPHTASWIKCLDTLAKLEIDIICPGHRKPARKDLLAIQKRYSSDLRETVQKGIDANKILEDITKELNFPW